MRNLPCGHPFACNVHSAETGEILYCGWCNAVSFQRDLTTDERNRADSYRALLEEAANGFSNVLIATSDNKRVYEWLERVKAAIAIEPKMERQ